jgi:hypothetical protein
VSAVTLLLPVTVCAMGVFEGGFYESGPVIDPVNFTAGPDARDLGLCGR